MAILGPSLTSSVIAVGVALIPSFARITRGSTLQAREMDYRGGQSSPGRRQQLILIHHILPNIVDPLIVLATLNLGSAILATAALSFLGLGTQLPTSDWGTLLSNGYEHMFQAWGEVTFPGTGDHHLGARGQFLRRCPEQCNRSPPMVPMSVDRRTVRK